MDERIEYLNRLESFKGVYSRASKRGRANRRNSSEISLGSYPIGDLWVILCSSKICMDRVSHIFIFNYLIGTEKKLN